MCSVEYIGSSELSSFGPLDSWSVDQQLEWVLDNVEIDCTEAPPPVCSSHTPSVEVEDFEGDDANETDTTGADFSFLRAMGDLTVDANEDEKVDPCPGSLRGCASASADIPGGPAMLRIVDRIEDEASGDHTTMLLPPTLDGTTEPTTPQVNVKRGTNSPSPGSCDKPEPSPSRKKRFRITHSAEYWDIKINGLDAPHERSADETPPDYKMERKSKMNGRDTWVAARMKARSDSGKKNTYDQMRRDLKKQWPDLPDDFKAAWCRFYEATREGNQAAAPPVDVQQFNEQTSPAQQVCVFVPMEVPSKSDASVHEFDDKEASRVHGYLLTWNGTWGHENSAVRALAERDLPLPLMVEAIKASPFYQWLWKRFKDFCSDYCQKFAWVKKSGKMEVTVRRVKAEHLVHFHLGVSDLSRRHRSAHTHEWVFLGARPHVVASGNRGRGLEDRLNIMHYYCQAPKLGTVRVFTNYRAFVECPVQTKTVFSLWSRYKMEDAVAMHQIRLTRGRGTENCIRDIECNITWRRALTAEAERQFCQWLFPMKPSKEMQDVTAWVALFHGRYGQRTRFPFLVLNGESRMGKTRYAVNLFGPARTLVVPCQGAKSPDLRNFKRAEHKSIVMDEADYKMVIGNKALFQAALEQVTLGQSTCNAYAYQVWLYGVPIIVSCNDWMHGAEDHERAWLDKNSVVVNVTEPLWRDEFEPLGNA